MPALSLEGLETELTVSLPWRVTVDLRGLDFKGLVQAIGEAAAAASSELLGWMVRAIERRGMEAQPDRWIHRGPLTRRVQVSWGTVPIRRTRVRDRTTGATYNLGDRLLHWRPYVRRSVAAVRTACELATSMSYRAARHGWQRMTGARCSVMNFWRMVQGAGQRLVREERDGVGEIRPQDPPPRAVRRVYLEADGVWLRRQKAGRRRRRSETSPATSPPTLPLAPREPDHWLMYVGADYSRLEPTGPSRRHAVDPQITVDIGDLCGFGRQWAWRVSRRFDLRRSANVLYLCDGEDGLFRLAQRHFPGALMPLDRFHVHQPWGRAFGLATPGYRTALSALCRKDLSRVRSLLALRGAGRRREVGEEVRGYLDRHASVLFTHEEGERRTTVGKTCPAPRRMGSGVLVLSLEGMEKTQALSREGIETQINRRMKRQGMSGSIRGARRLGKLRVLYREERRWDTFWSQMWSDPRSGKTDAR